MNLGRKEHCENIRRKEISHKILIEESNLKRRIWSLMQMEEYHNIRKSICKGSKFINMFQDRKEWQRRPQTFSFYRIVTFRNERFS